MPRPLNPHAKRVRLSLRLTEKQAGLIDARRGGMTRAAWAEALISAALRPREEKQG